MDEVASAVAGTMSDLFGADVAEEAPNSPDDSAAPEEAQVAELPELNPELPEDIIEFLEEPDDDDEEDFQVGTLETQDDDEFVDVEALARENAKLRKRLEWTEQQKQKASKRSWSEEAKKIAPLSRPETIQAQSRRAFLREARKQHEENFSLLSPHIEAYNAARAELEAKVRAEIRAEAEAAWGRPTTGTPGPAIAADKVDRVEKARNSRNLAKVARALIDTDQI